MTKILRIGTFLIGKTAGSSSLGSIRTFNKTVLAYNSRVISLNNLNLNQKRVITTTALNRQQGHEQKSEAFLNGSSAVYIEEIYQAWLKDPTSVHKSWDIFFRTNSVQAPPTLGQQTQQQQISSTDLNQLLTLLQQSAPNALLVDKSKAVAASSIDEKQIEDHLNLYALIRSYQIRGHKQASLDPLGIGRSLDVTNELVQDLTPEFYDFTEADLSREFKLPKTTFIGGNEQKMTLREILNRLKSVYTQSIGLEYMYINNFEKCNWIRQQFEAPGSGILTADEKSEP